MYIKSPLYSLEWRQDTPQRKHIRMSAIATRCSNGQHTAELYQILSIVSGSGAVVSILNAIIPSHWSVERLRVFVSVP